VTKRAVATGLLAAAFIAGFTYFNDNIMRQTLFIGNHMPHSIYGSLIVFLLVVNPALALLRRRWAFTGGELAVVLALSLAACSIPGAGLMRFFTNAVMLPHHKARTRPGWQAEDVVDMLPDYMLAGTPPALRTDDIPHPRGFCIDLAGGAAEGTLPPARQRIWELLSPEHHQRVAGAARAAPEEMDESAVARTLVSALNSLLDRRDLYEPTAFSGTTLPREADQLLKREERRAAATDAPAPRTDPSTRPHSIRHLHGHELRALNRHLIDAAWPDAIHDHARRRHEELYTFRIGANRTRTPVGIGDVPWSAWVRPLLFWLPLVLVLSAGLIGLAVVVHRQWSHHEQLPYPVARFAEALLPAEGEAKGSVVRNRLFLGTAAVVLAVHMNNYLCAWWPRFLVPIPTAFDFSSLQPLSPMLGDGVARWALFTVRFYPIALGLAYFVASDVALSIGIAAPIAIYVGGVLRHYGISISGSGLYSGSPMQTFHVGAYIGILLMLAYTGRRYYASVFRRAVFLRSEDDVAADAIWGARVFLCSAAGLTLYLTAAGIDWQLAFLYTLLAFTLFVVMSRILAETGLFFLEPRWFPCAFLVVMFGVRAVGPTTALLMFMTSTVLLVVPREALMPFVVNSLRVLDSRNVRVGRVALWCGVAVAVALVVAVPVTLMFQYGAGTHHWDTWGAGAVPRYAFDKTVELKQRLRAQGALEDSESVRGFARFLRAAPETRSAVGFAVGLALVLFLASARLRLTWWPIHPIIAVAFWNYPGVMLWPSFLLGWFLKRLIIKYGGNRVYRRLVPAMLGLIAGDMLGMLLPSIIGAIYYMAAGSGAPMFLIMPD